MRNGSNMTQQQEWMIGVSACLLGDNVRYDGDNKRHSVVVGELAQQYRLLGICPEAGAGLGIPRPPVQLVRVGDSVKALGVEVKSLDVTQPLSDYCLNKMDDLEDLCGFVLKARSPSCGYGSTPIHDERRLPVGTGNGMFANVLVTRFPCMPVIEEAQLEDLKQLGEFKARVNIYGAWKALCSQSLDWQALHAFYLANKQMLSELGDERPGRVEDWLNNHKNIAVNMVVLNEFCACLLAN